MRRLGFDAAVVGALAFGILGLEGAVPRLSSAVTITVGAEIVVGSVSTDSFPQVAMDANGDFLVVWGDQGDVFAQRYAADGTAMGARFTVNTITAGDQGNPDVAFIPSPQGQASSGLAMIVWSGPDNDQSGVYGNLFNSVNKRLFPGPDPLLHVHQTDSQHSPSVTANDSMIVVAWQYNDATGAYLNGRRFDTGGVAMADEQVFLANPFSADPDVAIDPSGNFVTVGSCFNCGGPNTFEEIIAERRDDSGLSFGGEFLVNGFSIDNQRFPQVEMAPSGNFLVTWDNGDLAMPRFQIFDAAKTKLFCPGGEPCERLAAELPTGIFKPIHVDPAMSANGSFVTVYETFVSGPGARIDGMAFHSNGDTTDSDESDPATLQFVLHDSSVEGAAARNPRVATSGRGRHVAVYDRSDLKVVARLFQRPNCGDPDGDGRTLTSEALFALRTAVGSLVGSAACPLCLCDVNGSGLVQSSDAQQMLFAAVGASTAALACPLCP